MTGTQQTVPETDPDRHPVPAGRSRRVLVWGVSIAVVVALAAVVVVQAWTLLGRHSQEGTRAEALAAASRQVQTLLSYDAAQLDGFQAVIDGSTTGTFHDDFTTLFDQAIRPNAKRLGATAKATVVGTGAVGSAGADTTVLVFVNQSTRTNAPGAGERVDTVQATVTMREVDGRWLIAGLDQV